MKTSNLIKILETSVAKNGAAHQLTVGHLLNIIKCVERLEENQMVKQEEFSDQIDTDFMNDTYNYGFGD